MQEIIELILSYLRGMWRYRWYALGVAWLICLGGWAYVSKMPDVYQASARVHVDTRSILRPLMRGLAIDTSSSAQLDLLTRTLLSRPNLEKLARMTDLDLRARDNEAMDRLLTSLQSKVSLSGDRRGGNIYNISVTDRDPQLAKKIVQSLLNIFMEEALGGMRQDSDSAQRFIDKQIAEYEARLIAAENRVKEFKLKNLGLMPNQGGDYYQRLQSVTNELEQVRLALRQAENRRDSLRQQMDDEELSEEYSLFAMDAGSSQLTSFSSPLDSRIQSLEQQLDGLLIRYTERHPDVIITRQTIADLKRQRQEEFAQWQTTMAQNAVDEGLGSNPYYQQVKVILGQEEANIASLQAQVKEYEQRLERMQERVNSILDVETKLADLNRDYSVTQQNYQALLARRETLHVSQQVGQTTESVQFKVIDPPRVPLDPSGPNRPVLMSGVLFGGLGAGLGLAFLMAQLWPVFDNRRTLMETTNIPVFGSVGMILSPARVRRERLGILAYCSLGAMLLTVYAGLVVVQATGLQIL